MQQQTDLLSMSVTKPVRCGRSHEHKNICTLSHYKLLQIILQNSTTHQLYETAKHINFTKQHNTSTLENSTTHQLYKTAQHINFTKQHNTSTLQNSTTHQLYKTAQHINFTHTHTSSTGYRKCAFCIFIRLLLI